MAPQKTTAKTTVATGALVPQPHGGAIRHGGKNKGGPGRPPKAYKQFLADCLNDGAGREELLSVVRNSNHPAYATLLGKIWLHLLGSPPRQELQTLIERDNPPAVYRLHDLLIADGEVEGGNIVEIPENFRVREEW
jgi:hypothetical protein